MQPCRAQCCWSARIRSWKVMAKAVPDLTRRDHLDRPAGRASAHASVDADAPQEVHALQPPSELRLDEPRQEPSRLGPERRRERLPCPGLDRRESLEQCRVDAG